MGKFQYTYNANATNYQSGSNDQTQWKDLTGCNNKDKCKTEPWSASRNQTTYIRACDKVGNCSGKSSTKIMIDKVVPTCTVKKTTTDSPNGVSVTITCSDPKINGQDGSGIKTCAGVNGATATKTGLKSSQTYTIVDNVGNKGTCKVTINSRKQYAQRHCNQCKSCSSAGCASRSSSWVCTSYGRRYVFAFCQTLSCMRTPGCCEGAGFGPFKANCGCQAYKPESYCVDGYHPCNSYYRNCSVCGGCNSWGSYGSWTRNKPTCSGAYSCKERTVFY
ncbi:MAG: hypothetical protein IKG27_05105, partial [Bacilli bacterium]|nr:hypothetical protein [Bacilli bacterium]